MGVDAMFLLPAALTELLCHAVGYVLYNMSNSLSSTVALKKEVWVTPINDTQGHTGPGAIGMSAAACLHIAGPEGWWPQYTPQPGLVTAITAEGEMGRGWNKMFNYILMTLLWSGSAFIFAWVISYFQLKLIVFYRQTSDLMITKGQFGKVISPVSYVLSPILVLFWAIAAALHAIAFHIYTREW